MSRTPSSDEPPPHPHPLTSRDIPRPLRDALLPELVAQAPVGIAVVDVDLRFVEVNARLAAMNGVPAADHLGRTIAEVLPDLAPVAVPRFAAVFATGEPVVDVLLSGATPAQPGVERHWSESIYPLRDDGGSVVAVAAVVLEVTDRVRAERERDEAHALVRALFRGAPLGLAFIDRDLRFREINDALAAANGRPAAEHVGRRLIDLSADFGPIVPHVERVLATGTPITDHLVEGPEEDRAFRASWFPVTVGDDTVGVGAIVEEIGERLRLEREREAALRTVRSERALLEDLVERLPAAVAIFAGPDLRPALVSRAVRELGVLLPGAGEGRPLREVAHPSGGPIVALLERVVREGVPVREEDVALVVPSDGPDAAARHFTISATPVRPEEAGTVGVLAVAVETTDEVRRRAALRADRDHSALLAAVSSALDVARDPAAGYAALAATCVPAVATFASVTAFERGRPRVASAVHVDPDRAEAVRAFLARFDPGPTLRADDLRAVGEGRPVALDLRVVLPRVTDPGQRGLVEALGVRHVALLPLVARGRVLGVLTLGRDGRDGFTDLEIDRLREVASRAALALDTTRLSAEQAHVARVLQAGLLPAAIPAIPAAEIVTRYHAAGEATAVGGDFYDVHAAREGTWALTIGDVCGRGAEAASLTALVRHTLRATAETLSPAAALGRLNAALVDRGDEAIPFATAITARLVPRPDGSATWTWANAGHPAPILVRADGTAEPLSLGGPLLGVQDEVDHREAQVVLAPGDAVVLYTDGVLEADRAAILEPEDLARELAAVGPDPLALTDRLHALARTDEPEPHDDTATLVLRVHDV